MPAPPARASLRNARPDRCEAALDQAHDSQTDHGRAKTKRPRLAVRRGPAPVGVMPVHSIGEVADDTGEVGDDIGEVADDIGEVAVADGIIDRTKRLIVLDMGGHVTLLRQLRSSRLSSGGLML